MPKLIRAATPTHCAAWDLTRSPPCVSTARGISQSTAQHPLRTSPSSRFTVYSLDFPGPEGESGTESTIDYDRTGLPETYAKDRKRVSGKFIYKITHPDGSETIEQCPWSAPMLQKPEYIDLFTRAGFDTQTFPGYNEAPDDGKHPILCFVCGPSL